MELFNNCLTHRMTIYKFLTNLTLAVHELFNCCLTLVRGVVSLRGEKLFNQLFNSEWLEQRIQKLGAELIN